MPCFLSRLEFFLNIAVKVSLVLVPSRDYYSCIHVSMREPFQRGHLPRLYLSLFSCCPVSHSLNCMRSAIFHTSCSAGTSCALPSPCVSFLPPRNDDFSQTWLSTVHTICAWESSIWLWFKSALICWNMKISDWLLWAPKQLVFQKTIYIL